MYRFVKERMLLKIAEFFPTIQIAGKTIKSWKNRNFVTFMSVFMDGYVCWSIYLMFLWILSVRIWKTETLSRSWIIESNGGMSMTLPSCCCKCTLSANVMVSRNSICCCCSSQMLWVSRKQLDHVFHSQPIRGLVYIVASEGI